MTTKSEFNAEEWERVAQAPALAALMVMVADRGGVIRESIALGKVYAEARSEGGSELIQALVESPPRIHPADMGPADQLRTELPQRVDEAVRTVEARPRRRRPGSTATSSCAWPTSWPTPRRRAACSASAARK